MESLTSIASSPSMTDSRMDVRARTMDFDSYPTNIEVDKEFGDVDDVHWEHLEVQQQQLATNSKNVSANSNPQKKLSSMAAGEGPGEGEGVKSVKLIGYWASPFVMRVEWALKLKGIEYEYIDEDLRNKSALLLQCNPVHKKVPVLVHDGKPVADSLTIIEYVDEVWKEKHPLLPQDPYERAKARFWANFADEKCVPPIVATFTKKGDEQDKSEKEARENLKTLESALEGKPFFGGETIGFVDISAAWIVLWAKMAGDIVSKKLVDEECLPLLSVWSKRVLESPIIKECLPPSEKLLEHISDRVSRR